MRFLFVTGRETNYQRNDVLWRAFNRIGEVERVGVTNRPKSIILNSLRLSISIILKLLQNSYDLVFVGFYGQLLMYPVSIFSRYPILFDAFVSTFDTLSSDRKIIQPRSLASRILISFDQHACNFASHVLLDTKAHAQYFSDLYHLPYAKISSIPVGCNEDIFYPRGIPKSDPISRVLYYSSYLPLHGVGTVVQAARLVQDKPIEFLLIGDGQTYEKNRDLAVEFGLKNIRFTDPIPLMELPAEIARSDICLGGHFGKTEKAARVIPGKVFQILAMEKPLIASNRGANLDLLQHEESAYLCNPNDPEDLAKAILQLHENPEQRNKIARKGREAYQVFASEKVITDSLKSIVEDLVH